MKKQLCKKGFTLVEVLVASAITVILLGSVMAVFSSTRNIISDMKKDPYNGRIENSVSEYIRRSVEKANGYRMAVISKDELNSKLATIYSELPIQTGEKNYCIIVSNKDGMYQLYDLGGVVSSSEIINRLNDSNVYTVFNSDYYGNLSCKVAITETKQNSLVQYICIATQLYDQDNQNVDKEKASYFQMLNKPDSANAKIISTELNSISTACPDDETYIVILYRIKDYTTP